MPRIQSKRIRVRDPRTKIWHDLPATVSKESILAAERARGYAAEAEETLEAVHAAEGEAIAAIESKGAETLETIPDDYTELDAEVKQLEKLPIFVTPEMYGAKGDGVTDDTAAIQRMCAANDGTPMEFNGVYRVIGNVFGYLDNPREKTDFILHGNNSTIIWESGGSDRSLFEFNWKVDKITIGELNIKCKNDGGIVFNYYGNTKSDVKAGAESSHIYDVRLKYYALGDVYFPDYVFYIHGYGHCDKMLVEKCGFGYFKNLYYCENGEAVNNTFLDCSFFTTYDGATYFDFQEMYDNFNVTQCSFSLYTNQTLIKNRYGENPNNFYFNFARNRYELYGSGTDFTLMDVKFGVITFSDENFSTSGFASKNLKILTGQNATFDFTNCYFRKAVIDIGQIVSPVVTVGKSYSYFKECSFVSVPDITYEGTITKKIVILNCNFPAVKNISYNAFEDGRYSGVYSANMFVQSFNSLLNYSFPPFYHADRLIVRRLTQTAQATNVTVTINGTDYVVSVDAAKGSEAVVPFIGYITTLSTAKNILCNIIVETSAKKLA